jgi:hypothetical protein
MLHSTHSTARMEPHKLLRMIQISRFRPRAMFTLSVGLVFLAISRGGTGNSTFTTGSIPFFDGTKMAEDNTKLNWVDDDGFGNGTLNIVGWVKSNSIRVGGIDVINGLGFGDSSSNPGLALSGQGPDAFSIGRPIIGGVTLDLSNVVGTPTMFLPIRMVGLHYFKAKQHPPFKSELIEVASQWLTATVAEYHSNSKRWSFIGYNYTAE